MLTDKDLAELRRQERWSSAFSFLTYLFLLGLSRLWWRYRWEDRETFQKEVWEQLDKHDGPVIWAANHLTLIDSFLIFEAIFPLSKAGRAKRVPWSTPEYRNYYHLGGFIRKRLIRGLMYVCRCIPFLREGEDEASVRWRESAYAKLVYILQNGGTAFVYPEAGRSRSGWFEKNRPKDFLGRLALDVPTAKFLCVYLRSDSQQYTTAIPDPGSTFRVKASLVDGVLPGETAPRQVSQRLFAEIGKLQEEWWQHSSLRKNCAGNDVVDLKHPLLQENIDAESGEADEEWLDRHLTPKERKYWDAQPAGERFRTFWKFFSAKEAAHKALAQAGIATPNGAFKMIEVDLFRRKATHVPSGCQLDFAFTDDDADKLHCVAILRGGYIGDDSVPADFLHHVEERVPGEDPSQAARDMCLRFIAESSDDIRESSLAVSDEGGIPRVLKAGKEMDWGVSLSHAGRYAACSFMVS